VGWLFVPEVRNFHFSFFFDSWVKDLKLSRNLYNYPVEFKGSKITIEFKTWNRFYIFFLENINHFRAVINPIKILCFIVFFLTYILLSISLTYILRIMLFYSLYCWHLKNKIAKTIYAMCTQTLYLCIHWSNIHFVCQIFS
jgi:hypothetical protein